VVSAKNGTFFLWNVQYHDANAMANTVCEKADTKFISQNIPKTLNSWSAVMKSCDTRWSNAHLATLHIDWPAAPLLVQYRSHFGSVHQSFSLNGPNKRRVPVSFGGVFIFTRARQKHGVRSAFDSRAYP